MLNARGDSADDPRVKPKMSDVSRLSSTDDEHSFEVKMAAVLFLRGCNSRRDFKLATNVDGVGALDDLIFQFTTPVNDAHTLFIQLIHTASKHLNMESVLNTVSEFHLARYFESFMDIKQLFGDDVRRALFNEGFESSHFTIFTNALLSDEDGGIETRDLSSPVDEFIKLSDVEASFTEELVERIYRLLSENEEMNETELRFPMSSNEDDAKDFLRRIRLYTGQPSADQLDDVIEAELRRLGIQNELSSVLRLLLERIKNWWQYCEGVILDQNTTYLLEAKAEAMLPYVEKLTQQQVENFRLDVKFLDTSTRSMKDACAGRHPCVNIVSEYESLRITATKFIQSLESRFPSDVIFLGTKCLQQETEAVMSAWRYGFKNLLVIVCKVTEYDEKFENIWCQLIKTLQENSTKRVVLVSSPDDSIAKRLQHDLGESFSTFQDAFHMSHLHQNTIKDIVEKQVMFQGFETNLGSLFGKTEVALSNTLKVDLLENIVSNKVLCLGNELQHEIPYYIPRTLQRKSDIKRTVLSDKRYAGKILIQNSSLKDVSSLIDLKEERSGMKFQRISEGLLFEADNVAESRVSCDDIHYLQLLDGKLVWKETNGDIDFVKKYVDETAAPRIIADPRDRVVLLVADPGMGKTTFLTHVANQIKHEHDECWVVNITLSDHISLLAKTKEDEANAEEFLMSALGIDKTSALNQTLLKHCINHSGNIAVLLDGFDAIPPKYVKSCLSLITNLLNTRVKQVWVSSRNVMRETLETAMSTLALTLKSFTEDDQREFLVKYWRTSTGLTCQELEESATTLLRATSHSVNAKAIKFTSVPLQTRLLAEVFQEFVTDKERMRPKRFTILELTKMFVEKKYRAYFDKTTNLEEFDDNYEEIFEQQRTVFAEKHSMAALIFFCSETDLQSLSSVDLKGSKKFFASIESGINKSGIIDRIVEGKPVFLHRVFAEYFVALWFSKNFLNNRDFLRKNLLGEAFGNIRQMFDELLADGHDLHCAILNADVQAVDSLLRRRANVTEKDKGGRTAFHLAEITKLYSQTEDSTYSQITTILKRSRPDGVDDADDVLQWTPRQYSDAIESQRRSHIPELTYRKTKGFATMEGQHFEVKLCALLFLRGINSDLEFQLATNVDGAGALDDVIYKIKPYTNWLTFFIQLKHKKNARLRKGMLLGTTGAFSLKKYLGSYLEIKSFSSDDSKPVLFDGSFDSFFFVIYTNAPVHNDLMNTERELWSSPVDGYVSSGVDSEFIFTLTEAADDDVYSALEPEGVDAKEFLNRLRLFTGQPNEKQLNDLITNELRRYCHKSRIVYNDLMYEKCELAFKNWWQSSEDILHQNSTIIIEAIQQATVDAMVLNSKSQFRLDINFQENATEKLNFLCKDSHSVVIVTLGESTLKTTCSKLLQALEWGRGSSDFLFLGMKCLRREIDSVVSVWSKGKKHLLVVVSDDEKTDAGLDGVCKKLLGVVRGDGNKRVVLVAPGDAVVIRMREGMTSGVLVVEDNFQMAQVDTECVQKIVSKMTSDIFESIVQQ